MLAQDGREVHLDQVIISHLASNGQPAFISTIARDIADRKRAEEQLREREARFRHLAEAVPQIVWTASPEGRITFINHRWTEFTGLSLEETNDLETVTAVIHPDDTERVFKRWAEALATGTLHEAQWRFRSKADRVLPVVSHPGAACA